MFMFVYLPQEFKKIFRFKKLATARYLNNSFNG